jgi:hypothetical protein
VNAEADEFARFVEARERALQRTAWLLTGDWALAEDLVRNGWLDHGRVHPIRSPGVQGIVMAVW